MGSLRCFITGKSFVSTAGSISRGRQSIATDGVIMVKLTTAPGGGQPLHPLLAPGASSVRRPDLRASLSGAFDVIFLDPTDAAVEVTRADDLDARPPPPGGEPPEVDVGAGAREAGHPSQRSPPLRPP